VFDCKIAELRSQAPNTGIELRPHVMFSALTLRRSDLSQSRHKAPINNFKRGFERGPTSDATI
jgi:hypothetical protein